MCRCIIILFLYYTAVLSKKETPIIGVLSQETYLVRKYFPNEFHRSFIAASYVKQLESGGARVIPIWLGREDSYYQNVVKYTNGILWPGGGVWFNDTNNYADAARKLYKHAVNANKNGDYYPIWTTCLGMELLAEIAMNKLDTRIRCDARDMALPLKLKKDFHKSKLFGDIPEDVVELLKTQNVTYNYHGFCITDRMFTDFNLHEDWLIHSTNRDRNGLEFVSTFESRIYPFYAVQFHPEKNQFEFNENLRIPHSRKAVKVAQYFTDFFVEECRKNNHTFPDWQSKQKALIYNYNARFIGKLNASYEQVYMFSETDNKQPL